MLYDNHNRVINYLRLAVTDRCNLRCFYCMPEEGIDYVPRKDLMTFEEMERVIKLFATVGITKLRITGGEPFLRKGIMDFIEKISKIEKLEKIHITTNGTLIKEHVPALVNMGIDSINLSLDSLDRDRFFKITRRDTFDEVMNTLDVFLANNMKVKINMVVMKDQNIEDIIPMIHLAEKYPVSVRFIEEMPFNGSGKKDEEGYWDMNTILNYIRNHFPNVTKLKDPPHSTSFNYKSGNAYFGIIAAYSRLFCGSCNRIRLTPRGMIKTCLYDDGIFNIKDIMRAGAKDEDVLNTFRAAVNSRAKDGFEAEQNRFKNPLVSESMATIGG